MTCTVVIPARYGSTRFPGKPLALVAGQSLIARVWRIAKAVAEVDEVLVATDDTRIAEHVRGFGGEAVMTPSACRNGSERVHAALEARRAAPEIVVNLQGDAVLTPSWVVADVVRAMRSNAELEIATPCVRLSWDDLEARRAARAAGVVGGTTVVRARNGDALYFSKETVPLLRNEAALRASGASCPVFRHIGLYAYRAQSLARYLELEAGVLEELEGLEQLRALEHGMRVHCVEVDYRGRAHASIDNPEDVGLVESILAEQGEPLDADS